MERSSIDLMRSRAMYAQGVTAFSTKLHVIWARCTLKGRFESLWSESASKRLINIKYSVGHFNALVDLEEEYATSRRKIVAGFEDIHKITQDIDNHLQNIIRDHDRQSLSKQFPNSWFSGPLSISLNSALLWSMCQHTCAFLFQSLQFPDDQNILQQLFPPFTLELIHVITLHCESYLSRADPWIEHRLRIK